METTDMTEIMGDGADEAARLLAGVCKAGEAR
jgi:hypothetical protein